MRDFRITEQKYDFVCFRCGCIIKTGEKMVSLSVSVETPTEDGGLESIDATAISTLCSGCASVLLGQAITRDPGLMVPHERETEDEEADIEEETNESSGYFNSIQDMLETVYYGSASEEDGEQEQAEEDPPLADSDNADERSIATMPKYDGMDEVDFLLTLGVNFLKDEEWEQAITAFSSVIELEPDNAFAYDRRGIAHGRAERYDEAIPDFSRAISVAPAFAGPYNNRGLSYYKQCRFDEAIADYSTAIQLSPDVAVFYANRGLAHSQRGDLYAAIADYNRSIELDPSLPEIHNYRGEAYAELGEYEKALADFEYELALNPNDIVAYANRVSMGGISADYPQPESNDCEKGDF